MFHLTCFHIILVRLILLSGHIFGKSCSLGRPYGLFVLGLFKLKLFLVFVLRWDLGSDCDSSWPLLTC